MFTFNLRWASLCPVIPTRKLWKELSAQPWLHDGESDPLDERTGQSVLCVWIHNPEPRVYICQVPLDDSGAYCGAVYQRQDRALTHVRTHLNYKPFACRGRCGMKDWWVAFNFPCLGSTHSCYLLIVPMLSHRRLT